MSGPHITECEDGSTVIEWILPNARFYISLEPDQVESSWGYVTKSGPMECGLLPTMFYRIILSKLEGDT